MTVIVIDVAPASLALAALTLRFTDIGQVGSTVNVQSEFDKVVAPVEFQLVVVLPIAFNNSDLQLVYNAPEVVYLIAVPDGVIADTPVDKVDGTALGDVPILAK